MKRRQDSHVRTHVSRSAPKARRSATSQSLSLWGARGHTPDVGSRQYPLFDTSLVNRRNVPKLAISTPRQGDCKPMNECPKLRSAGRALTVDDWGVSDLGAFGQLQSVCDIHAEVADGTFNFRMGEKDLNCA
jgi:hypothetical protein